MTQIRNKPIFEITSILMQMAYSANGQRSTVIAGGGKIQFENVSEVNITLNVEGFSVINKYDIVGSKIMFFFSASWTEHNCCCLLHILLLNTAYFINILCKTIFNMER